jgi:hypothetical protein
MRRRTVAIALAWAAAVLVPVACTDDEPSASAPATDDGPAADARKPIDIVNTDAWPMHPIDGRYRGANALGGADVNGDGHTDYITNYEFDQRWVVELHPGDGADVRTSWPTVEVWRPDPLVEGNGKNSESTALGDVDGDGNIDAVGAHGFSDIAAFEGSAPGVHVVWGPSPDRVTDPSAWVDGGWVPATVDVGHPHWIAAHDVNGDGLTDIAVGGRLQGGGGGYENPDIPSGNQTFTGIGWLEAPADPAQRRNLDQWRFHRIDADAFSGHGFVFADIDGDGDDDIVDANADFDTPQDQEDVAWYENPGNGSDAQRGEWTRRQLYNSPDFYAKPSVAVGDIDGDGAPDIVTQTNDDLILFRQTDEPGSFETVTIPKPPEIAWRSRAVRLADIDGDGDLDIVGMLIHEDNQLPADKAAVYVLLNEGQPWSADGWRLLPIKWGSGETMLVPGFGEKWDQVDVVDVDGDGDLDIVANCEEWWAEPKGEVAPFFSPDLATSSVAVVWFENRLNEPASITPETDGLVRVEAERPSAIGDSTWVERAPVRDDPTGTPALQALNGLAPADEQPIAADATEGVDYTVDVDGGTYTVWVRTFEPARFGNGLGGDLSDSLWLVGEGTAPQVVGDAAGGPSDQWVWVRAPSALTLEAGRHNIGLRVRERGVAVDQIVLARDAGYTPA